MIVCDLYKSDRMKPPDSSVSSQCVTVLLTNCTAGSENAGDVWQLTMADGKVEVRLVQSACGVGIKVKIEAANCFQLEVDRYERNRSP